MENQARPIATVLFSLYICEAGLLGFSLGVYKRGDTTVSQYLGSLPGLFTCASATLLVAGSIWLVFSLRNAHGYSGRRIRLTILLNGFTILAAMLSSEGLLRTVGAETPRGVRIFGTELLPYSWTALAEHNRTLLDRAARERLWTGSYLVYDPELGWVVGANRSASHRFSFSSTEGIRASAPGVSFRDAAQGKRVIALVGDSYTFGLDVRYEESWGYWLQKELGDRFLVLNFGVDGYGVDQAYLRYLRDVPSWHPEIVIFGLIQHDFTRSLSVYSFLTFPSWEFPFAKPRFEIRNNSLELRNVPVPTPEEIFARERIEDLPFLHLEVSFDPEEWQERAINGSYLVRTLLTRFRRWSPNHLVAPGGPYRSISVGILRSFMEHCDAEGALPLLTYFPSKGAGDFPEVGIEMSGDQKGRAKRILREEGFDFVDLTRWLRRIPAEYRFVEGKTHYSAAGNRAAADGIAEVIRARVSLRDR